MSSAPHAREDRLGPAVRDRVDHELRPHLVAEAARVIYRSGRVVVVPQIAIRARGRVLQAQAVRAHVLRPVVLGAAQVAEAAAEAPVDGQVARPPVAHVPLAGGDGGVMLANSSNKVLRRAPLFDKS